MSWVDVRSHTHKLLFRYDPQRALIEIVRAGETTLVDLTVYHRVPVSTSPNAESVSANPTGNTDGNTFKRRTGKLCP
jgi:hypothetical protein